MEDKAVMFEKFYAAVSPSVSEVMETMGALKLNAGEPYLSDTSNYNDKVSAVIGITGPDVSGAFLFHFDKPIALQLASSIFGTESTEVSAETQDACGEIANMISGCIKKITVKEGGVTEFNITVPTIIVGGNYSANVGFRATSHLFPFSLEEKQVIVELKLK